MRVYEVIIPARNGGQALVNSIQSVLSCSNSDRLFLTVSDNFSTDGAPWKTVLEKFPEDAWRVISPPQPIGRVEHWTWAFAQAKLPWVKPLLVGDRVENAYWDWVAPAIAEYPGAGLFFSGSYMIDPGRAHPDATPAAVRKPDAVVYTYDDFMRDAIQCRNRIGSLCHALFRAETLRLALPFEPQYPWTADWRFYKRFLQHAPAVRTSTPLVCLDRSIARLSTSWKGLRGSFGEDWKFAAEQAMLAHEPFVPAFFARFKAVGSRMGWVIGRMILPRPVRGFLTTITGLHRHAHAQKT